MAATYVADIDSVALLNTGAGVVGEGVRGDRGGVGGLEATRGGATIAAAAAKAAESTAGAAKATTTKAASETTAGAAKAATAKAAGAAHGWAGEAILTDLEHAALPIVAVELLDGVASVLGGLENDNAGALRSAVGAELNISADNATGAGC